MRPSLRFYIRFESAITFDLFQDASGAPSPTRAAAKRRALEKARLQKQKLVSHSTAMESIQAQTEPIDEQEHLP